MPRLALALLFALAAVACGDANSPAGLPEATSAAEVADRMLAAFDANFAEADSFAVSGAGLRMVYRVLPDTLQGDAALDRFQISGAPIDSVVMDPEAAQLLQTQIPNVPRIAQGFREAAFDGLQEVGERRAYVLSSEDPGALIGELGATADEPDLQQTLRILVDAETYDIVEVFRTARVDSLERPLTQRIVYEDFRAENGLRLPHVVRQINEGLDQYVTDEDRMIMGGQLGMQRQRLEQQPASPERDARLKSIQSQTDFLSGQPQQYELTVDRVEVFER